VASQHLIRELQRLTEAQSAPDELSMVIQHCFPHGSILPGTAEVHLADASEEVVLRLAFARAGRFEAIAEPSLSDEDAQTLIKVIGELEGGRTPTVWRVVLFASLPVNGTFRYRDRWQIRPGLDDAPKPSFVMAPHPFVLEVKGLAVSEGFVRWLQGGKLLREAELVLSLVPHGGLAPDRSTSPSHEWVVLRAGSTPRTAPHQLPCSRRPVTSCRRCQVRATTFRTSQKSSRSVWFPMTILRAARD
jgi:hypothetical protein